MSTEVQKRRSWKNGPTWADKPRVNFVREMIIASAVSLAGAMLWRNWHMGYREHVDSYYKEYQEKMAKLEAASETSG